MSGNNEVWGADQYSISLQVVNGGAIESLELSAIRALSKSDIDYIENRLALLSEIHSEASFAVGSLTATGSKGIIQSKGIKLPAGAVPASTESLLKRDELQEMLRTVLGFLDSLHAKQLAHKNLRPEFIYRFGEKLLVGGLSLSSLPPTELLRINKNSNNEIWLAPEQEVDGQASPASDIYTLGLICFFFATGKVLRVAGNLGAKEKGVIRAEVGNSRLATLIIESLHLNPNRRPTAISAQRILEDIPLKAPERREAIEIASFDPARVLGKLAAIFGSVAPRLKSPLGLASIGAIAAISIFGTVGVLAMNPQGQSEAEIGQALPTQSDVAAAADSVESQETPKAQDSQVEDLVMPNFEGMKPDDVTDFLLKSGVRHWRESTVGSSIPKGMVAYTTPAAGEKLDLDFWNKKANYIEIHVSTGSDQAQSSKNLTAEGAGISWGSIDKPKLGSWGFYNPTVKDGVLAVAVDAKFTRDTTILLGKNCSFLVNEVLNLGCPNNNPEEIFAKADQWISPITFYMNIYTGKINTPAVFEISLRLKDANGVRNETLFFTVKSWK